MWEYADPAHSLSMSTLTYQVDPSAVAEAARNTLRQGLDVADAAVVAAPDAGWCTGTAAAAVAELVTAAEAVGEQLGDLGERLRRTGELAEESDLLAHRLLSLLTVGTFLA